MKAARVTSRVKERRAREKSGQLRLLLLERSLARFWLEQSYVKSEAKKAIRERLVWFESEIRKLQGALGRRRPAHSLLIFTDFPKSGLSSEAPSG
jgi:hypothetical protein